MDQITGGGAGALASPARIDSIITNWTGTLGRYTIQASDAALRKSGYVKGEKAEKQLEDLPVIKAFLTRNPKGSSEYISRFYKKSKKADAIFATQKKLLDEGNVEEAQKLIAESDLNLIAFTGAKETMSGLRTFIRSVNNNKDMSAVEKRQLIDQSYQAMIDIARQTLETYYSLDDE